MKKLVTVIAVSALFLTGCTADKNPDPAPLPSVDVLPSETVSGWPTPPNITRPPYTESTGDPEPAQTVKPSVTSTVGAAVPPATEFAQRWGKKYPDVPEFVILKAANATCAILENASPDWSANPFTVTAIEAAMKGVDMPSSEAVEFAQDAQQNYCSSIS